MPMTEIDEVRWQRDEAKAKLLPLRTENERLLMLLGYAEKAILAEYNLRVYGNEFAAHGEKIKEG